MNTEQRVLYESTEISTDVNDFRAGTAAFSYTSGQYLYVGSILPFNNLFFEMGTLNLVTTVPSVDIWWGHAWNAAVDLIDETNGLKQNGRLQWRPELATGWDMEQLSSDVTGLPTTSRMYNLFWARLSWGTTMTTGTTIKYIGQKFATDSILYSFYPDLDNSTIRSSFASGKTTWDEQHYMASEHIIRDLKKRNIVKSRSQILDASLLVDAACHKVAEIVYTAMGQPYFEQLQQVKKDYSAALNVRFFNVDLNQDAELSNVERRQSTVFATR